MQFGGGREPVKIYSGDGFPSTTTPEIPKRNTNNIRYLKDEPDFADVNFSKKGDAEHCYCDLTPTQVELIYQMTQLFGSKPEITLTYYESRTAKLKPLDYSLTVSIRGDKLIKMLPETEELGPDEIETDIHKCKRQENGKYNASGYSGEFASIEALSKLSKTEITITTRTKGGIIEFARYFPNHEVLESLKVWSLQNYPGIEPEDETSVITFYLPIQRLESEPSDEYLLLKREEAGVKGIGELRLATYRGGEPAALKLIIAKLDELREEMDKF